MDMEIFIADVREKFSNSDAGKTRPLFVLISINLRVLTSE